MKFPLCNSFCDVETADLASVLINDDAMSDDDTIFQDEVDEPPTSLVPTLALIEECAVKLATTDEDSL